MASESMVSPDRVQRQHFPPLAGEASVYNVAFNEAQIQMGKPLNTTNLDELLKNGNLSKKTIDEVWKEIVQHDHLVNAASNQPVHRQLTFGETTLEDFLVRAGVFNAQNQDGLLNPQPLTATDPMALVSQRADWLQFQMAAAQQQQMVVLDSNFHVSGSVFDDPVAIVGNPEDQMALSVPVPMPMPVVAASSSDSRVTLEGKRKLSDEMMEKTIERRQKRMIKNRESAARSRARKQAYTNQLEHEVLQLKKRNSWLNKQKEAEMLLSSNPTPTPRYQLRRTSSASF
ncbi:ABSCISIC ACID-INSENSITIVE 5-like protein 3 [Malania oleifera]|uniref:ABSCISIC ACID-INSENSITIVE 5-like protein 3 n=1 Tax=Malania oleifera TaxID=397392 RepID=UPI0025AE925D|nr:ABSCISIC ACID-INSENSITIVE 5-like protein 3 [Malania oleifera]